MRTLWLGLVFVGACGDVKDNPDAAIDAPAGSDADAPIDVPTGLGPWGAPTKLANISGPNLDWGPSARGDLLELYFSSDRPGSMGLDIYVTTRASVTGSFGAPVLVGPLNSSGAEAQPIVSSDGLTMYFAAYVDANLFDIYTSTRPGLGSAWAAPTKVAPLNGTATEAPVYVSPDGLLLLLSSDRNGNFDLFQSTRASTSQAWGAPVALSELNTSGAEFDAFLSEDKHTIYFSSDMGGAGIDLYTATRTGTTGAFVGRTPVAELNSASGDEDVWISPDQRTLIFTSDRDGTRDLFVSTR